MKVKLIIVLFFMAVNLTGCSQDTECFVADSVVPIKMIKVDEVDYSIYLRISGIHEKEAFYELYKSKPMFNVCGKSNALPVADVHIDSTKGAVSKLVIDNNKLIVVYSIDSPQESDLKDVKIEVELLAPASSRR